MQKNRATYIARFFLSLCHDVSLSSCRHYDIRLNDKVLDCRKMFIFAKKKLNENISTSIFLA